MTSFDNTTQPLPPGGIDPLLLPSVALDNRATLPVVPAVYFCLTDDQILYVDCTVNLNQRWIANQQYVHLEAIPNVRIAWLLVDEPEQLQPIKQAMIEFWEPKLNDWRYKLQSDQDINIDGWHDFQKVDLQIWATYRDAVMPIPVPKEIAAAYRKEMNSKAAKLKKIAAQERRQRIEQLQAEIQNLESQEFVPPAGCYLSPYKVKRPYGTYEYWKLWSHKPVFPMRMSDGQKAFWASQGKEYHKSKKVKTLHLGVILSPAYRLAIAGLETRKRIEALERQVELLLASLGEE